VTWTVRYTETAAKAIRKLDPQTKARVRAAIDVLREDPHGGKPLQLTLKGLDSWRTGDWRIVYRTAGALPASQGLYFKLKARCDASAPAL
jgi:mRNA-degrading endonuclease RelE of RelBE toxin-antitoxin system